MHALIIEDEKLIALQIEDILRDIGYQSFDHASSVSDAVDAARDRCPGLITADHRIIGGTGAQAVLKICSGRFIPVLFVTSSEKEVKEHIPQALVVDKPFSSWSLCKFVEEAIRNPLGHSCA